MNNNRQKMRTMSRAGRAFLGTVICVVVLMAPCSAADEEAILARIKSAWTERLNVIGKVRYHLSGSATYLPGSLVPSGDPNFPTEMSAPTGLPEREATQPIHVVWTFDFPNRLLRKDSHDWSYLIDQGTYRPIVRTDVFNGKELKGVIPREANTGGGHAPGPLDADFEIGSNSKIPRFFNFADLPVLFAHGLFRFIPASLCDGGVSALPPLMVLLHPDQTPDASVVVLSAKTEQPEGEKKSFVEHEQRFWVDLSKNAAIVRWEDRFNSKAARQVTAQWQQHGSHWLPESWTFSKFNVTNSGTKPMLFYRYRVERVELDPDVGRMDFDVQYGPGMIVRRLSDNTRFQVAADGKTLRIVGPRPRSKMNPVRTTPTRNGWWFSAVLVGSGIGLATIYFRLRVSESQ